MNGAWFGLMTVARYIALSLISRYHCLDPTNRDISGLHCIDLPSNVDSLNIRLLMHLTELFLHCDLYQHFCFTITKANQVIATKFCTYHDSTAVMASVKICSISENLKWNFQEDRFFFFKFKFQVKCHEGQWALAYDAQNQHMSLQ